MLPEQSSLIIQLLFFVFIGDFHGSEYDNLCMTYKVNECAGHNLQKHIKRLMFSLRF